MSSRRAGCGTGRGGRRRPGGGRHRAFTLLEVVLALSLSAAILGLLSTALYLHLRLVGAGSSGVEEAQLARVVLSRMAEDLRSTVRHDASATEEVNQLLSSVTSTADLDELLGEAGGTSGGGTGTAAVQDESEEMTSEDDNDSAHTTAGLYGTATELQVDISRLPRPDEYGGVLTGSAGEPQVSVPYDLRTVTYYLASGSASAGAAAAGQGLVRREMNRAAAVWSAEQGETDASLDEQLLAAEVTGLAFRYFDGTEWTSDWDSEERGSPPVAVEVAIELLPAAGSAAQVAGPAPVYRLLVHLPGAEPTDAEDSTMTEEENTETPPSNNATSNSSNTGASGS
jgi:hypothetical protein